MVKNTFSGGALVLTNMDGEELTHPINFDAVRERHQHVSNLLDPWLGYPCAV